MRHRIIILAALVQLVILSGCTSSKTVLGPKKEVNSYSEETVEVEKLLVLDIFCDSGNIEMYTWDKDKVKFEMTKRVRGTEDEETLKQKFENFSIDISQNENNVIFRSEYKGKDKNPIDKSIDLKIYVPKAEKTLNLKLDTGNIKFYDDIKGVLNADINMANMEINRFLGVVNIKGNVGNVIISNGKIYGTSGIIKNIGSISVKAELQEGGDYTFKTGTGNIDLMLPKYSKISFESVGELEVNEFSDFSHPTKAKVETSMGKIAITSY
ncbi:MAG TPA: hypothetical protein PLH43_04585 [Acetivibrio sp.]|uniref:hypothetical protein n=1 Tax=Acetivibrio sp. TaxID=1872092 RepID=UPI002D1A5ECD|nr:hypothetical protein [Acetivibrio sp.]HOM02088.1 hypothetical protein [Acetivibrio sp.]